MSWTDDDRTRVALFREFVEDSVAADDRYGPVTRHDAADESVLASRFDMTEGCWLEVAVLPHESKIRVGFGGSERDHADQLEQSATESGATLSQFVGTCLVEAGLDWVDPSVERGEDGNGQPYFATSFVLEELGDVDFPNVRGKTVRMLEGYLIAFGSSIVPEDDDDEDDDD